MPKLAVHADGDGYANLLEYATGGNPAVPDSGSSLTAVFTNGGFLINFNRNINSTDTTIIVQRSTALESGVWAGIATNHFGIWSGAAVVQETGAGSVHNVSVQDTATSDQQFYRLDVTEP